jgi:hypothetical protein
MMARREVTGRRRETTGNLIERDSGPPDPEDDEEGDDPIDPQDPESDESDDGESDDDEPSKHDEPATQALVTRPQIRGPPHRLVRKAKIRKAKTHPKKPVPDEADAYSIPAFCRRHGISVQLFYKFEETMPDTFHVGKRRLISREAAAKWRADRTEANA